LKLILFTALWASDIKLGARGWSEAGGRMVGHARFSDAEFLTYVSEDAGAVSAPRLCSVLPALRYGPRRANSGTTRQTGCGQSFGSAACILRRPRRAETIATNLLERAALTWNGIFLRPNGVWTFPLGDG
jgi:hypothetical protein